MLINQAWRFSFSRAKVHHLFHYKPNHNPLLLELDMGKPPNCRRKPFHFQAIWMGHEEFEPLIHKNWRNNVNWQNLWI